MSELSNTTRAMLLVSVIAAAVLAWALLTREADNDPISLGKLTLITTPPAQPATMIGLKKCLRAKDFSVHAASDRELVITHPGMSKVNLIVLDQLAAGEVYGPDHPGAPADWGIAGNATYSRAVYEGKAGRQAQAAFKTCMPAPATS